MRDLTTRPVFGIEWEGCHAPIHREKFCVKEDYQMRNDRKLIAWLPIANFVVGAHYIEEGIKVLSQGKGDHPELKATAFIARGVITVLGGGILCLFADGVVSATRYFFRKEPPESSSE